MTPFLSRDEDQVSVELGADRLAFVVLSFGVLIAVAYRSFALGLASWDLLGVVVVAGLVGAAYRAWHGVLTRSSTAVLLAAAGVACVVAAGLVILGR